MTRIVLIDDHRLFRAGLVALLDSQPEFSVVAQAGTAEEGFELISSHRCDLVVVDYHLPDQDGPVLIARLRRHFPELPILLLSRTTEAARVREAMNAGSHGYLIKDSEEEELLTALRVVASGGMYVHPVATPALLGLQQESEPEFTETEVSIMRLLARGSSNRQLCDELHLSLGTVKRKLSELYDRLSVQDRAQLAAEAVARGLVPSR